MLGYDLTVFGSSQQQAIIADVLEDLARLATDLQKAQRHIEVLEAEVKWLKRHTEPDLRYMG